MRGTKTLAWIAAVAGVALAVPFAALGEVTLTFEFAGFAPHAGQALALRVVDDATRVEVARVLLPEVPGETFQLDLAPFSEGRTYQIDYFIDQNANGLYDAPPTDAAWRFFVSSIVGPGIVSVVRATAHTDIGWPPAIDGVVGANEYRNSLNDAATGIRVHWHNDAVVLYVALVAPGTGWVGIGFDPDSRMQGANYILGAVSGGVLSITDEFGVSGVTHRTDAVAHIVQAAGQEAGGVTTIEFAIPLASGDAEDKPLAPGQVVTALLAMNATQDSFSARHTARSAITMTLDGGN